MANVTTPTASTVVFTMKKAVNPEWFLDDELAVVSPIPAHAWARASADGPMLDFTVTANAARIYKYLSQESMALGTYASNPLWQVVDGPYRLTAFNRSTGAFTMKPDSSYNGPRAARFQRDLRFRLPHHPRGFQRTRHLERGQLQRRDRELTH